MQITSGFQGSGVVNNSYMPQNSVNLHPVMQCLSVSFVLVTPPIYQMNITLISLKIFSYVIQAEEVIDKVVKEAISKPWLPLPLGLKPPSADSVLAELSRQGIYTIPPHINGSHLC